MTKGRITEGQIIHRDNVMWQWPIGSIAVGCSSGAVMPLLRNEWSVLLYTPQQRLPMLYNKLYNPQNWHWPPSNTWFCEPMRVNPQMASQAVRPFWHSLPSYQQRQQRQTDTQTMLHATCVHSLPLYPTQTDWQTDRQTHRPRYVRRVYQQTAFYAPCSGDVA